MVPHMLRPGSLAGQEALDECGDCIAWHSACQHQERHLHVHLPFISSNAETSSPDISVACFPHHHWPNALKRFGPTACWHEYGEQQLYGQNWMSLQSET